MVPLMSIWRNFFLGQEPTRGRGPLRRFDIAQARRVAREQIGEMGVDVRDPEQPVGTLSGGERQSVAIARAIYFGARVLILDEPTSALGVKQAGVVLRYVVRAGERGVGVIFITHNPHHALPGRRPLRPAQPRPGARRPREAGRHPRAARARDGGRRRAGGADARARGADRVGGGLVTVRLTAAQALVRFLAAQYVERDGVEQPLLRRLLGHLRPRQRRRHRRRRCEQPRPARLLPGAQRAGDGARRRRLRQDEEPPARSPARPRSARARPTWSPARRSRPSTGCRCCCCPATSSPRAAATRCCSSSRSPGRRTSRSTTASGRCRATGTASTGPSSSYRRALQAMRVLTRPGRDRRGHAGAAAGRPGEAYDFPDEFFAQRVWHIPRAAPDARASRRRRELIRAARRPLIVAGGGVIYSEATGALRALLPSRPASRSARRRRARARCPTTIRSRLGAVGVTGTGGANLVAARRRPRDRRRHALRDFTTASKTAFQNPDVRFVNVNVAEFDADKHAGAAAGRRRARHARASWRELLEGWHGRRRATARAAARAEREWDAEVARLYNLDHGPLPARAR